MPTSRKKLDVVMGGKKQHGKKKENFHKKVQNKSNSGSCRHKSTVQIPAVLKCRDFRMCKTENCSKEDEISVCLGCGNVGCVSHSKKHWAKAKTDRHVLIMSMVDFSVYCFECDRKYAPECIVGDLLKCREHFQSRNDGKIGETDEETIGNKSKKKEKNNKYAPPSSSSSSNAVDFNDASNKVCKGLSNLGNTCYFNSVVQCLSYNFNVRQAPVVGSCTRIFLSTLNRMWSGSGKSLSPADLLKVVKAASPQFRGGQQQDAHELLRCLLDVLDMEYKKSKEVGFVRRLFHGELFSFITCHVCKKTHCKKDEMFDLSVDLRIADEKSAKKKETTKKTKQPFQPFMPVFQGKIFPKFFPEKRPFFLNVGEKDPESEIEAPKMYVAGNHFDCRDKDAIRSNALLMNFTKPYILKGKFSFLIWHLFTLQRSQQISLLKMRNFERCLQTNDAWKAPTYPCVAL